MIILDYMRCIKLISIICFAVFCSPLLLAYWCINKPTPPVDVKNHLSTVTIEELAKLRSLDYKHNSSAAVDADFSTSTIEAESCCICMDDFSQKDR
jgi:hypothetical protein